MAPTSLVLGRVDAMFACVIILLVLLVAGEYRHDRGTTGHHQNAAGTYDLGIKFPFYGEALWLGRGTETGP